MDVDPIKECASSERPSEPLTLPLRWGIAVTVLGLWACSLSLPAAYFVRIPGPLWGSDILLLGWMGIPFQPAWLANIGLFIMLPIFLHGKPGGRLLGGGGVAMALCATSGLFWHEWPQGTDYQASVTWGPGFYLWSAAMFGIAVAALGRCVRCRSLRQS
jgi:hypothetical protein